MPIDPDRLPLIKRQLQDIAQHQPELWDMITDKGHCCPSMVGLPDLCAQTATRDIPCAECWQQAIAGEKAAVIKNGAYYCPDCDEKLTPAQILPGGAQQWRCPKCKKEYSILTRE